MRLADAYQPGEFGLSIEIFPPKSEDGDNALMTALERLAVYGPAFVSCTYGAGGTTRTRTVDWCRKIQEQLQLPATAHFTCVGASRAELIEWLSFAATHGIRNIMALRGDPPQGSDTFEPAADGLVHANELVELIRQHQPEMGVGVAGYPEGHPESSSLEVDLENLKRKVDAGADAVFTQLFFDNQAFLKFRDRCQQGGISVPIVPGIMPITEFSRIQRITSMCGATIPASLAERLEAVQDDQKAQFEIGVEFAIEQCRQLIDASVAGIHFYVLNRSQACRRILESLGIEPQSPPGGH